MYARGSITIFFTLLLSIMISLISTMLLSAKVAAGRVQIALAVDLAMFSAMAKYDRQLFEEYHLCYIDGGYGTGTLQLGKALDEVESDLSYLLTPNKEKELMGGENFLQLEKISGSITGYTLATDCNGRVFMEQVVSYMKDTLGIQGISLLTQKLMSEKEIIESQGHLKDENDQKGTLRDYEDIKTEILEMQKKEEVVITEETLQTANQTREVLDTVSVLRESSVLNLVLPSPQSVSGWTGDETALFKNRSFQQGMGYLEVSEEETLVEDILFQEYMLQTLNHYQSEKRAEGPAYGVEWALFGKISDMENLEAMAVRLLAIREAANVASLCMDNEKMNLIRALSEALATVLEVPYIKLVIEGALVLAWAFVESLVDVRAIFQGEQVVLVKSDRTWQVSFSEILGAIQNPEQYYQDKGGMSYEDYLRVFLLLRSREKKVQGCMEVIEQSVREMPGKEQFSMDCALDALEVEFRVRSQDCITFDIARKRSYRTIEGGA